MSTGPGVLVMAGGGATVSAGGGVNVAPGITVKAVAVGPMIFPQVARYAEPRPSTDILRKSRREILVFIAMVLSLYWVSMGGYADCITVYTNCMRTLI